jgi:3D (Asp-Asp-Asp) domain-containing protein
LLAAAIGFLRRRFSGPARALPLGAVLALALVPAVGRAAAGARILVDGQTIEVARAENTVGEALEAARVTLGPDDEVTPGPETLLTDAALIRVQRISYKESVSDVKIPYRTVVRAATPSKRPYHPTVMQEGRTGLKRVTYRVRLVDGVEQGRQRLGEEVVREAVAQVVVSRKPQFLGSRGVYTGKRVLTVVATAYDPGPGSCGKHANGKTCNGKRAGYGIIAVDPKQIPLGSKLFVPGYGYGIAADVGSAIQGNRIDLGYNSRSGAIAWGKKTVKLTIVE